MFICLFALSTAMAEDAPNPWTLTPTAEIRPRLEASTGRDGASGAESWYVSQRSRLGLDLSRDGFSGRVLVADVRVWGSELDTLKDLSADTFDLHEGWLRFQVGEKLHLTVGRQELAWDEQRLVGAVDWTQQGRAFDAARLAWRRGPWTAEASAAMIYDADTATNVVLTEDTRALLARAAWSPKDGGATAALVSVLETNAGADLQRETVGLYVAGRSGILSGRLEGYAQIGSLGAASYGAYLIGASGTVAPELQWKPAITLWFDNLSGDADATDSTLGAFTPPYATNHKFYGIMDVMCFSEACAVDGQGLRDAALKLDLNPIDKLKISLDAHGFLAAEPVGEALLGEEIDLWASGPLGRGLSLAGGGAALLRPNLDTDLWAALQLDLKL